MRRLCLDRSRFLCGHCKESFNGGVLYVVVYNKWLLKLYDQK